MPHISEKFCATGKAELIHQMGFHFPFCTSTLLEKPASTWREHKNFFAKFRKLFPSTFSTSKCAEKTLMETVTHTFQLFHSITIICNLLQGNVFMWQQLIMCINKRSLIVILCWSVIIILNISWVSWVKQGSDLQWIEMECEIKS